jgi:hypothetical protein
MTVYVVFKTGIYRHECGGVFSTLSLARIAALSLIAGECDPYHTYEVVPFGLDVATTQTERVEGQTGYFGGGDLEEADPILLLSRHIDGVVVVEERSSK